MKDKMNGIWTISAERPRRGSTLTEVLVAIMISSIGLVSVATLFPLSALRAIRAAQLTSAADVRYNAETQIDLHQAMISNPIYLPYPTNPNATQASQTFWDPQQLNPTVFPQSYIIDPLGFAMIQNLNTTVGSSLNPVYRNRPEHFFGNDPVTNTPWQFLPRYPLYWRTVAAADFVVTLPDSWIFQLSATSVPLTAIQDPGLPASPVIGATQIDVPGIAALVQNGGLPIGGTNPTVRVVIFSSDGLSSHARNVTLFPAMVTPLPTQTTANTAMWTEDVNSNGTLDTGEDVNNNGNLDQYLLPVGFVPGIVRVEQQDRRYTWLLTMRQASTGLASVDVVVFFNRSFDTITDDEWLYVTPAPLNLIANPGQTSWGFTANSNQVFIAYTVGGQKPFMRKGGFIFDANNALWYRIANVNDPGAGTATITLEVPATLSGPTTGGRAMFPRGVVDVFPIGSKSYSNQ